MDENLEMILKAAFEAGYNMGRGMVASPIVIDVLWTEFKRDATPLDQMRLVRNV